MIDYDKKMDSQNHSVLLEVTKTKQDSKKKLLSTKDNCHLVWINLRDPNQCSNLKNMCAKPWITTLNIKRLRKNMAFIAR